MKISNIFKAREGFKILQSTPLSQSAVMALSPGECSSEEMNSHPRSDQTLVVLQGTLAGEIGSEKRLLREGDSITVPSGTPHRFVNNGGEDAITFNVYSPPAYPKGDGD